MVQPDRPQMSILYSTEEMQYARQIAKARPYVRTHTNTGAYAHTIIKFNTYCISTAALVMHTHLNITLHIHCLSCY
jgi:hypothetical protein